jgi:hypothetical protein
MKLLFGILLFGKRLIGVDLLIYDMNIIFTAERNEELSASILSLVIIAFGCDWLIFITVIFHLIIVLVNFLEGRPLDDETGVSLTHLAENGSQTDSQDNRQNNLPVVGI